jgi:hypothetical protein
MTGDGGDTYLVETSAGQLTVQYGWNRWVSVQAQPELLEKGCNVSPLL